MNLASFHGNICHYGISYGILLGRLQIPQLEMSSALAKHHTTYHFHKLQFGMPTLHLAAGRVRAQQGLSLMLFMELWKWWSSLLSKHGFRLRGIQSFSNRW